MKLCCMPFRYILASEQLCWFATLFASNLPEVSKWMSHWQSWQFALTSFYELTAVRVTLLGSPDIISAWDFSQFQLCTTVPYWAARLAQQPLSQTATSYTMPTAVCCCHSASHVQRRMLSLSISCTKTCMCKPSLILIKLLHCQK